MGRRGSASGTALAKMKDINAEALSTAMQKSMTRAERAGLVEAGLVGFDSDLDQGPGSPTCVKPTKDGSTPRAGGIGGMEPRSRWEAGMVQQERKCDTADLSIDTGYCPWGACAPEDAEALANNRLHWLQAGATAIPAAQQPIREESVEERLRRKLFGGMVPQPCSDAAAADARTDAALTCHADSSQLGRASLNSSSSDSESEVPREIIDEKRRRQTLANRDCRPRAAHRKLEMDASKCAVNDESSSDFEQDEYHVDELQIALVISRLPGVTIAEAKDAICNTQGDLERVIDLIDPDGSNRIKCDREREVVYDHHKEAWRWSTELNT